jgi:hypothetical protein
MLRKYILLSIGLVGLVFIPSMFLSTASAKAGTYNVIQCAVGINNDSSYTVNSVGNGMTFGNTCKFAEQWTANKTGYLRFRTAAQDGPGTVPEGRKTTFTWQAPPGTTFESVIAYLRAEGDMQRGWRLMTYKIWPNGNETIDKSMCTDFNTCTGLNRLPLSAIGWERKQTVAGGGYVGYKASLTCVRPAGCEKQPMTDVLMNSLRFAVNDNVDPSVSLFLTPLVQGNWVRGTQGVGAIQRDQESGYYQGKVTLNNTIISQTNPATDCDLFESSTADILGENGRQFRPCPTENVASALQIDTSLIASGTHNMSFCGIDFSRNEGCQQFTARIDNTLPSSSSSPNPGSAGSNLNLQTVASDAHSGLSRVEYKTGLYDPFNPVASIASVAFSSPQCVDSSAPFNCNLDLSSFPDNETVAVVVQTYDNVGNLFQQVLLGPDDNGIVIDKTKPVVQINNKPALNTNLVNASFSFTADKPVSSFTCQLDLLPSEPCSSTKAYFNLNQGNHSLTVTAVDLLGNQSDPVSYTWKIDTVAPSVAIDTHPPTSTSSSTADFTFSSNESPDVSYQCKLDSAVWVNCSTPIQYSGLNNGNHTFQVRAIDLAGNVSDPATWDWVIGNLPGVSISSTPPAKSVTDSATFVFVSSDQSASLECRLDTGLWTNCISPKLYTALDDGPHQFAVRATNGNGTGPAATYNWVVDTQNPVITIVSGPADESKIKTPDPQFAFTLNEPVSSIDCRLGVGLRSQGAPMWSGFEDCQSGNFAPGPLADGEYTIQIRATDQFGLEGSEYREFTIDTVAPTVTITSGPSGTVLTNNANLVFSSNEDPNISYQCRLDNANWSNCISPMNYSALAQGSHIFRVRGTDQAGNISEVVSRSWIVDSGPPVANFINTPAKLSSSGSAQFTFSSNKQPVTWECKLDNNSWQNCQSPANYNNLPDGSHQLQVRAKDNLDQTGPVISYQWFIDSKPPVVKITSGPQRINNKRTAKLTFTSNDDQAIYQCKLDNQNWQACSLVKKYNNLKAGNHTFKVRATDLSGNSSFPAVWNWTVDTQDKQCKLSYIRSRFFVFTAPGKKYQAVRLVARYKAYNKGTVRISFYERGKRNNVGRKIATMNANFNKKTSGFGLIRVRKQLPLAQMKKLRKSKRGFVAFARVQNSPGYCRDSFFKELQLSNKRIIQGQNVWFQKGSFSKAKKK